MRCGVPVVPGTPGPVDSYTDGDAFISEVDQACAAEAAADVLIARG